MQNKNKGKVAYLVTLTEHIIKCVFSNCDNIETTLEKYNRNAVFTIAYVFVRCQRNSAVLDLTYAAGSYRCSKRVLGIFHLARLLDARGR